MTSDVKVFANLYDDIIHFDSKEEFNRYYAKNKEAIDKMATRGLNVKFKINGFKIGRSKGELILYPIKDSTEFVETTQDSVDETGLTCHQKLNNLNSRLKNIENILTGFIEAFSNKNDEPKQQRQQQPMQQQSSRQQQPMQHHIPATRFNTFGI